MSNMCQLRMSKTKVRQMVESGEMFFFLASQVALEPAQACELVMRAPLL